MVGVAVEEAIHEYLVEHGAPDLLGCPRAIHGGGGRREAVGAMAPHALGRQHLPRGELPDHLGNAHLHTGRCQALLQPSGIVGLDGVRHLVLDLRGEPTDEARKVVPSQGLDLPGQQHGGVRQDLDIGLDDPAHPGTKDLHRHLAPVLEDRRVHLSERGGGEGIAIDGGDDLLDRPPELALDDPAHLREGNDRPFVLEVAQLGDDGGWKQIRPRAEDLPQLDEGGPQPGQREPEPARPRQVGVFPGRPAPAAYGEQSREPELVEDIPESVVENQNRNDLTHAAEVAKPDA